ncbi:hypothetical protein pipiens_001090 [Culex pipiens pipiens]|uniref:glycogenin glucosyltransferase n=3 Tax=Culex pipiens TaxID=7175 RepID=A0ABD1CL82_CULPP
MSKFAWVTLATNDSYSLGALVVAHSLKRVHTAHQLAVLITPGVSESMRNKLRTVFNLVEEVNLLDSKDKSNLALLKRPELGITFTKLHCWRLTQYEKCVFLDADTLVLRNCDELFEREELSAAPDVGWPDCFNSGVYVYKPNLETFSSLMEYAVTHGSFDGGDQGLLNSYFSDWAHKDIAKHLPFVYNTSSVASYSYLPAFKQFGQNTKILHFIGTAKPWLQNFNSETRKVYIPGGYQHLANFLQFWWDIFCEDVHSRLSADMQRVFDPWIKPVPVSGSAYRSVGTDYLAPQGQQQHFHQGGQQFGDGGGGGGLDANGNYGTQAWHAREEFIPSYETLTEYVDPWEDYLRKQDEERERRALEGQKREEERLYFQYLDNQRNQEHQQWLQQQQQSDHTHHEHPHHEHHHHQANVFQSTEHWVENVQSRDQQGHWENPPQPAPQMPPTSDWQPEHHVEHHHHHPAEQQHHDQPQGETHTGHESGSGLAGALSQLHLGEPKSSEQEAYEEHMRRQCWESGNIDYMGRDSFDNIWRRIKQTLDEAAAAAAAKESTPPAPVRAISPAPMRFRHSSKSRSRSTTPKRDMRDRSPTPQPEDNVPVEKKEAPEEDDGPSAAAQLDESAKRSKLPAPPVQYDPKTSTTTLTKKVFAGYQQVITTKSPEGKTHTHTKTVYDPSIDEVDAPIKVASAPVVKTEQKATPPPATSTSSSPPPRAEEVPTTKSTPPRVSASPKPQMPQPQQQQVAQETMADRNGCQIITKDFYHYNYKCYKAYYDAISRHSSSLTTTGVVQNPFRRTRYDRRCQHRRSGHYRSSGSATGSTPSQAGK